MVLGYPTCVTTARSGQPANIMCGFSGEFTEPDRARAVRSGQVWSLSIGFSASAFWALRDPRNGRHAVAQVEHFWCWFVHAQDGAEVTSGAGSQLATAVGSAGLLWLMVIVGEPSSA